MSFARAWSNTEAAIVRQSHHRAPFVTRQILHDGMHTSCRTDRLDGEIRRKTGGTSQGAASCRPRAFLRSRAARCIENGVPTSAPSSPNAIAASVWPIRR